MRKLPMLRTFLGFACLLVLAGVQAASAQTRATGGGANILPSTWTQTINKPPYTPSALAPRGGVTVRLTGEGLVLRASTFRDINPPTVPFGRHARSQWVVTSYVPWPVMGPASPNATSIIAPTQLVFDSGPTSKSLVMCLVPNKLFRSGTSYSWKVRYADAGGLWSAWSVAANFMIAPEIIRDLKPAGLKVTQAKPGISIYVDKLAPVILKLPWMLGMNYAIRTLSSDAITSGPGTLISFTSDLPLNVMIAYDDRATTLPQWLWGFKPYRPVVPLSILNSGSAGTISSSGAAVRGVDVSILPPERIPPQYYKMVVSDREAPLRRLLVREFKAGEAIALGKNLPPPEVDAKTTATLRMYGVLVQPRYNFITPLPVEPRPTPTPRVTPPPFTTTSRGAVTLNQR